MAGDECNLRWDRIAWFGRNVDLFYPMLFAAMRIGAVMVPVNWRSTVCETRYILEDARPRLIIVGESSATLDAGTIAIDADAAGLRAPLVAMPPAPRTGDGRFRLRLLQSYAMTEISGGCATLARPATIWPGPSCSGPSVARRGGARSRSVIRLAYFASPAHRAKVG